MKSLKIRGFNCHKPGKKRKKGHIFVLKSLLGVSIAISQKNIGKKVRFLY
jgi:hypothetical protein